MPRSIFVSFVFEDKAFYDRIQAWNEEGNLGPGLVIIGEGRDVRQDGDAAIYNLLGSRIQGAAAVLVLVGNDTHNHEFVRYELSYATSANKLVFPVRIPLTTGPAPEGFRHLKMLLFDPGAIRMALDGSR